MARFSDSCHQFASGLHLPSAGGSTHVLRDETFRSSTFHPFITSNRYGPGSQTPLLMWSGRKQAGAHSGTSGTDLFGYELLTPSSHSGRTRCLLSRYLHRELQSGALGASIAAQESGAAHMTASQHVPCRSWRDKGCLDWDETRKRQALSVFTYQTA